MSMSFALLAGGAIFCASDTRFNHNVLGDYGDYGGKLVRLPYGWAAAAGNAASVLRGLRRLADGEDPVTAVNGAHSSVQAECADVIDRTVFVIAYDTGRITRLGTDGTREDYDRSGAYVFAWPPELTPVDSRAATNAFVQVAERATSLSDFIRVIGRTFAATSRQAKSMSRQVDLGVTVPGHAGYLRADAAQLAGADDDVIGPMLGVPPDVHTAQRGAWQYVFGSRG